MVLVVLGMAMWGVRAAAYCSEECGCQWNAACRCKHAQFEVQCRCRHLVTSTVALRLARSGALAPATLRQPLPDFDEILGLCTSECAPNARFRGEYVQVGTSAGHLCVVR